MQRVVDDCLALDANRLAKSGMFGMEKCSASLKWENGNSMGLLYTTGSLVLSYTMGGEARKQTVRVTEAPCHFGGMRYYLHCPGCHRRSYKLRLAHSGFYCRDCYRLPYYSQECGHLDGLINQRNKVQDKLDDSNRPRMRTYTQMRLIGQLCALEDRIDRAMAERFGAATMKQFGIFA